MKKKGKGTEFEDFTRGELDNVLLRVYGMEREELQRESCKRVPAYTLSDMILTGTSMTTASV